MADNCQIVMLGVCIQACGFTRLLTVRQLCACVCLCVEQIVCARICGWPYTFMVTTDDVKKGQELLYDYGHSYCKWRLPLGWGKHTAT